MNITRVVTLHEGEAAAAVVRNHWIASVRDFLVSAILIALPLFLMIPLFQFGTAGVVVFALIGFVGLLIGTRAFYLWYWNCFIVTNERVVDVDQRGFFDRVVSESAYDKIQDVSYQVKGIIGTVLNVGLLVVQTAGSNTNLELLHVKNPQEIQHLIVRKMAAYGNGRSRGERAQELVAAAAEMSDAEARAFVTELQQAMAEERAKDNRPSHPSGAAEIELPSDWREGGEEEAGPLSGWSKKNV